MAEVVHAISEACSGPSEEASQVRSVLHAARAEAAEARAVAAEAQRKKLEEKAQKKAEAKAKVPNYDP